MRSCRSGFIAASPGIAAAWIEDPSWSVRRPGGVLLIPSKTPPRSNLRPN